MGYVDKHRWRKAAIALSSAGIIGLVAYDMRASLGSMAAIVLASAALLAFAYGIYKAIFGDGHSFGEAIIYALTPDILSSITNERKADDISTFRLWLWIAGVVGVGYLYFKALLA